jgi:hypothetical protein
MTRRIVGDTYWSAMCPVNRFLIEEVVRVSGLEGTLFIVRILKLSVTAGKHCSPLITSRRF